MPRALTRLAAALVILILASGCADPQLKGHEPVVVPPSATPERMYVVKPGDTLYSIAARFDTTVEALSVANALSDPSLISVGLQLIIAHPDEVNASLARVVDPCEGYRVVAGHIGGLLAQLRSGATDSGAALRAADRIDAELQQLPKTIPAYQALESAIDAAAVTASAAGLGRSMDAISALDKARTFLDAGLEHLEACAHGESP